MSSLALGSAQLLKVFGHALLGVPRQALQVGGAGGVLGGPLQLGAEFLVGLLSEPLALGQPAELRLAFQVHERPLADLLEPGVGFGVPVAFARPDPSLVVHALALF